MKKRSTTEPIREAMPAAYYTKDFIEALVAKHMEQIGFQFRAQIAELKEQMARLAAKDKAVC